MGKFNFKNDFDFENVKTEVETFYSSIGSVYCPFFREKIAFNAKGLRHLKFKSDQKARSRNDQYPRLKLVHIVPEVIRLSHTLQGVWYARQFEVQERNSRSEKILKDVSYFEFVAVLDTIRVKVIVKEVSGGEKYFWSVIPFWKIDRKNSRRILYGGEPEDE